jgi:hypothetical protein
MARVGRCPPSPEILLHPPPPTPAVQRILSHASTPDNGQAAPEGPRFTVCAAGVDAIVEPVWKPPSRCVGPARHPAPSNRRGPRNGRTYIRYQTPTRDGFWSTPGGEEVPDDGKQDVDPGGPRSAVAPPREPGGRGPIDAADLRRRDVRRQPAAMWVLAVGNCLNNRGRGRSPRRLKSAPTHDTAMRWDRMIHDCSGTFAARS